jgi:hypothetical protein
MKNIVLGMIGLFIALYTILIGLHVLYIQTQKNELEKQVSRIVKHTLEEEFGTGDETVVEQMLLEEIRTSVSTKSGQIEIEIKELDLQKGILSIKVIKRVEMLNGKEKEIVVEKTAIMERAYISSIRDVSTNWLVET